MPADTRKNKVPGEQSLIILHTGKNKLTAAQTAFNKLTVKIEKLQKEIEKKQAQLDTAIQLLGQELYPAELLLMKQGRQLLVVLWDIYKAGKLSKPDQRNLKAVIKYHLLEIIKNEDLPDELHHIYFDLEGETYAAFLQRQNEARKAQLKAFLQKAKVNFTVPDLDDETVIAEKIASAKEKLAAQKNIGTEPPPGKKNKTTRQLGFEKIQSETAQEKQKNISTIYKQLAKLFHPDLEQDEALKAEKAVLMQELIAAYDAKDLHALLGLELKWIHKETNNLANLTDDKLVLYVSILKEQEKELEHKKSTLFEQPQYSVLVHAFGYKAKQYPVELVKQQLKTITAAISVFKQDIENFTSREGLRHVKKMLKEWQQQAANDF